MHCGWQLWYDSWKNGEAHAPDSKKRSVEQKVKIIINWYLCFRTKKRTQKRNVEEDVEEDAEEDSEMVSEMDSEGDREEDIEADAVKFLFFYFMWRDVTIHQKECFKQKVFL